MGSTVDRPLQLIDQNNARLDQKSSSVQNKWTAENCRTGLLMIYVPDELSQILSRHGQNGHESLTRFKI